MRNGTLFHIADAFAWYTQLTCGHEVWQCKDGHCFHGVMHAGSQYVCRCGRADNNQCVKQAYYRVSTTISRSSLCSLCESAI